MRKISPSSEQGSALLVLALVIAAVSCVVFAQQFMTMSGKKDTMRLLIHAQAQNVAKGGITDAINWFRRQPDQPVRQSSAFNNYGYADAAFNPRTSTNPLTSATIEEAVGLVKESPLASAVTTNASAILWTRYEVRKQPSDPGSGVGDVHAVRDISHLRAPGGTRGDGTVWYLESTGYIYKRVDPNVPFNQAPNVVMARARAATEIWHLTLNLPEAAVLVKNLDWVSLSGNTRINGSTTGIGYYERTTSPSIASSVNITGGIADVTVTAPYTANSHMRIARILGAEEEQLKQMTDLTVAAAHIPNPYPSGKFIWIDGNAVFDGDRPLNNGSGVMFVKGNLTITSEAHGVFSGLIMVQGNATIEGPVSISGALIVTGNLTISGSGADINYDAGILTMVRQQMIQYRQNNAIRYVNVTNF